MSKENQIMVAYVPGSNRIVTQIGSNGKGIYFGQSKYQLRKEFPNVTFISLDKAIEEIDKVDELLCTNPKRISKKIWYDALEVLPPADWRSIHGVEVFHCMEMYTSDISNIYFRVSLKNGETKYYSCLNRVDRKEILVNVLLNGLIEETIMY